MSQTGQPADGAADSPQPAQKTPLAIPDWIAELATAEKLSADLTRKIWQAYHLAHRCSKCLGEPHWPKCWLCNGTGKQWPGRVEAWRPTSTELELRNALERRGPVHYSDMVARPEPKDKR